MAARATAAHRPRAHPHHVAHLRGAVHRHRRAVPRHRRHGESRWHPQRRNPSRASGPAQSSGHQHERRARLGAHRHTRRDRGSRYPVAHRAPTPRHARVGGERRTRCQFTRQKRGYPPHMGDRADDPVDHARTTRKHAGQNWKNTRALPALTAIGVSSACIFAALFSFANGSPTAGVVFATIAAALLAGGLAWLRRERHRVRRIEAKYLRQHPEADAQPPAS